MTKTKYFDFSNFTIPYIIAEIGLNHNGNEELALKMVEAAARSGANAVKFQLYKTENFIEKKASLPSSIEGSLLDFFQQFELPEDSWIKIKTLADKLQVDFFCSVFDHESLVFYKTKLNPDFIKVASTDLNNYLLLDEIKKYQYNVFLSTGASEEKEIEAYFQRYGSPFMLMQCVSNYPALPMEYNLSLLPYWKKKYQCYVGISDHCIENHVAIASMFFEASAIEKHFTIDRNLPGPDQKMSITPKELQKLKKDLEFIYSSIGSPNKISLDSEENVRMFGRRSLFYNKDLPKGHKLQKDDIIALRPGGGIPPNEYENVLNKILTRDVIKGERIKYDELS
jgi:N,N'-diacetyllegionaminate synthase